ncbi:MAG TPA: hypothetical protein VFQ76_06375 [Longimicrobiaceae bacterium]|nr:hypothetical protein [Longimicrobiaceae bacterium]
MSARDPLLDVYDALRTISNGDGEVDTVVIQTPDRASFYVQFCVQPGRVIWGEAVSNAYLDPEHALSPVQRQRLVDDGWHEPEGDVRNYFRQWPIRGSHDVLDIARATLRAFTDVYGVASPVDLLIEVF